MCVWGGGGISREWGVYRRLYMRGSLLEESAFVQYIELVGYSSTDSRRHILQTDIQCQW